MEREKWHVEKLPAGYPTQCSNEDLSNALQDLIDEYRQKKLGGKNNKIWEDIISQLIKQGRDEMSSRIEKHGPITITYAGGEGGKGGLWSGGGGGGGAGPGGGRGGDGGSVVVMPPKTSGVWKWIFDHVFQIIVAVIVAAIVYWLGWS